MLHSHQITIATDWLQTGFWLASDYKIGVNETMLHQCNPTAFYQSGASLKRVGSQFEASRLQIWFWCEFTIMVRSLQIYCSRLSDRTAKNIGCGTHCFQQSKAGSIGQSGANLFENDLVWMKHYASFTPNDLLPTVQSDFKNWVWHPLLPTVWSQSDRTVGANLSENYLVWMKHYGTTHTCDAFQHYQESHWRRAYLNFASN